MPDTSHAINCATDANHTLRYRPDIDGLRSLAILPIILLHCGLSILHGGFIGVDIFFVISGFLITGIVTREIAENRFSLLQFYQRRVVRILPALAVMMVVALVLGCFLLLPDALRDLGYSTTATSVFGSNFYFYATSNYFSERADVQPLIHTWSLAVEEQFYLVYPLLLLSLHRFDRKFLIRVLVAIGAVSFAVGGWLAAYDASAGYLLLPARIWELALGALVALGAYPRFAPGLLRSTLCILALLGIGLCVTFTRSGWPFPVPLALPPVAGAAFLLAYMPGTPVARVLETAPLRAIGRISYSLYLWHRPIIAFYLLGRGVTLTLVDSAILLTATFVAATASFYLVEQPALRVWRSASGPAKASSGFKPLAIAALGILSFAAAGFLVATEAERIRPLPPEVARVAGYLGFDDTKAGRAQFDTDRCFVMPTGSDYDPACMILGPGRSNVLLVGDSHAAQLSQALRAQMPSRRLVQATAVGCRPLLHGKGLDRCREVVENAFHHLDFRRIDMVILAGRWLENDPEPLAETVRYVRGRGVDVMVLGPMVEYDAEVPDALARGMLAGNPARIAAWRLEDRRVLDRRMAPIIAAAGGTYVSWFPLECPHDKCRLFMPSGAPLHVDHSHATPELASEMAAVITKKIRSQAVR